MVLAGYRPGTAVSFHEPPAFESWAFSERPPALTTADAVEPDTFTLFTVALEKSRFSSAFASPCAAATAAAQSFTPSGPPTFFTNAACPSAVIKVHAVFPSPAPNAFTKFSVTARTSLAFEELDDDPPPQPASATTTAPTAS